MKKHFLDKNSLNINDIKKKNQEFFDKIQIPFYEISNNPIQEFLNKKLTSAFTKFLKYVPKDSIENKFILDAGCNNGYFFDFYKEQGAKKIIGCDISSGALLRGLKTKTGILRKKNKAIKFKNFIQSDLESMSLKNNSLDSIFCFGTWHHIVQRESFLKECNRILKKNGFLIISDPNELQPLRKITNFLGERLGILLKEEFHASPDFTKKILAKYGFKKIKTYYYNLFSEGASRFCGILLEKKSKSFYFFAIIFLFFTFIDFISEKTIIKISPKFAWSYIIISKKI